MMVTPDQVAEARRRYAVSRLAAEQVTLKRRGRELVGLCPFHKEKTPSFTVRDDLGFYHCFGCGAHGDVIAWRMFWSGESFPEAVRALLGEIEIKAPVRAPASPAIEDHGTQTLVEIARQIWREARPIAGTPGDGYYRGRGIVPERLPLGTYPPTLRYHPHVLKGPRREGHWLPAWIAAVQDVRGQIVAVHRGYLDPVTLRDALPKKFAGEDGKALLGAARGGTVRLTPWAPRMGTCEGIETGLSVLQAWPDQGLWAGIDTGHMAVVDWPAETEALVHFADRDRADERPWLEARRADGSTWRRRNPNFGRRPGEHWARKSAERFLAGARGRAAAIRVPPGEKADFNDLLVEESAA